MCHLKYLATILLFVFSFVCSATATAQNISDSHIKANVPETLEQFDKIMKRDLNEYFKNSFGNSLKVEYELLRRGPTQSGIAYPKFYAWVTVWKGKAIVTEGAVRVASIEKTHIEVTHFISKSEILQNHNVIEHVFPKVLEASLMEKAK